MVVFGRISGGCYFYVPLLAVLFLRNARLDSGYIFFCTVSGGLWANFHFFYVLGLLGSCKLVELPEFVSFALLPGQDYSLVWEQIVDTPVPHGRGRAHRGGLQGARPGQNSAAFYGAEHVEIPVPQGRGGRGGLLGLRPDSNSAASSAHSGAAYEVFPGFFALFPEEKKCDVGSALGVGTECGLYFMDAGGLRRAHVARASAGGGV